MNLNVSKAAATRILSNDPELSHSNIAVKEVRQLKHVVLVRYRFNGGNCATFVSYKAFDRDSLEFRIEGSKALADVVAIGHGCYKVRGSKGDWYSVDLAVDSCTCPDSTYRNVICKHQLLVLQTAK
jgi:hypothetical protein